MEPVLCDHWLEIMEPRMLFASYRCKFHKFRRFQQISKFTQRLGPFKKIEFIFKFVNFQF